MLQFPELVLLIITGCSNLTEKSTQLNLQTTKFTTVAQGDDFLDDFEFDENGTTVTYSVKTYDENRGWREPGVYVVFNDNKSITFDSIWALTFSPDGKEVSYYAEKAGTLYKVHNNITEWIDPVEYGQRIYNESYGFESNKMNGSSTNILWEYDTIINCENQNEIINLSVNEWSYWTLTIIAIGTDGTVAAILSSQGRSAPRIPSRSILIINPENNCYYKKIDAGYFERAFFVENKLIYLADEPYQGGSEKKYVGFWNENSSKEWTHYDKIKNLKVTPNGKEIYYQASLGNDIFWVVEKI